MQQEQQRFKKFFEENLNSEQQKAVVQKSGSLLVIAGAGSGKTRVITSRIIHLIVNEEIAPQTIVALTFTNKAATEMKERLFHFLGAHVEKTFIGTFHSYCLYLLRHNAHMLPFTQFSILDSDDQQQLLQSIIKRNGLQKKITAKNLSYQISLRKNSGLEPSTAPHDQIFEQLYLTYEQEKSLSKSLDFDDLLLEVLCLFNNNSIFKNQFQQRVRHILIDEYQDTNVVQHELLKHMALNNKEFSVDSLCAVGDEDQSIYSWRGATVANIMHFKNDFPATVNIKIEQNYRSAEPILAVANHVIQNNKQRTPKALWSTRKATDRVRIITTLSGYNEAETLAQSLQSANKTKLIRSKAVLYRAHYQSRIIEEALLRNSIPYKIIGGIQFYERKEIKDMLAYVRLVVNPFDRVSFFRVINTPARGLGEKAEQELYELWHKEPLYSFHDLIDHIISHELFTGKKAEQLKSFLRLFKKVSHTDKPSHCINHFIYETDYYSYLKELYEPQEAESKIDNIKELLRGAQYFETRTDTSLALFLYDIALMQEKINEQESSQEHVYLMTLHGAKGLEFDLVFLAGLEEGLFPSNHSLYNADGLEEERRLFYVGITRAKEYLIISNARWRHTYGSMTDQRPSRFLHEIPERLASKHDLSTMNSEELSPFFSQWYTNKIDKTEYKTNTVTFGAAKKTVEKKEETNHKESKIAAIPISENKNNSFKKYQSVHHTTFGIGIVESIEQKDDATTYVTAKFKVGLKKIKADFLQKI